MENNRSCSNEIRQKNKSAIFRLFRLSQHLSRQDIVSKLGLSLPTVTQYLHELLCEDLIIQSGFVGCTGGRRAKAYALYDCSRIAIGLDITRQHVTVVALNLRGKLLTSIRHTLDFDRSDNYFLHLGQLVQKAVREAGLTPERILGVGIGVPGLLTPDKQSLFYCAALGFPDVTLGELSRYIPYPTTLCHDTAAAGFAEIWSSPNISTAFYLMLNASVGGSFYIGGKPYDGRNFRSGEVGHMLLVPGGRQCYCGHCGCMDAYCNAGILSNAAGGSLDRFFYLLKQGNPHIQSVWLEYLGHLAQTIQNLRMLFDCDIIIGGYVGSYITPYIDELRAILGQCDPFEPQADYLIPCRYKTESVATGAALSYISSFLDSV